MPEIDKNPRNEIGSVKFTLEKSKNKEKNKKELTSKMPFLWRTLDMVGSFDYSHIQILIIKHVI